jgi:hypothetical protein
VARAGTNNNIPMTVRIADSDDDSDTGMSYRGSSSKSSQQQSLSVDVHDAMNEENISLSFKEVESPGKISDFDGSAFKDVLSPEDGYALNLSVDITEEKFEPLNGHTPFREVQSFRMNETALASGKGPSKEVEEAKVLLDAQIKSIDLMRAWIFAHKSALALTR